MSETVAAAKTRLRALVRGRLAGVGASDRAAKSEALAARLDSLAEVSRTAVLLIHRALPSEAATEPLLAAALARGQRVLAPRVNGQELHFVHVDFETRWRRSRLGVLEPESGDPLRPDELGAGGTVIVPGLAFDEAGGRLGRGGGHYDRFLREARRTGPITAIAVAFELQLISVVPLEEHDERVDQIVTESRVIRCRV